MRFESNFQDEYVLTYDIFLTMTAVIVVVIAFDAVPIANFEEEKKKYYIV